MYDSAVIYESARSLLAQAETVAMHSAFAWGIAGAVTGILLYGILDVSLWALVALTMAGTALGWLGGKAAAFNLRLRAMNSLVLVRIEENTRRS